MYRTAPSTPDPYFLSHAPGPEGRPRQRSVADNMGAGSSSQQAHAPAAKEKNKSKPFWHKLRKRRPEGGRITPNVMVHQDPFSSVRLPDMDFRTERLSVGPMWLLASQSAETERQEIEEKRKRNAAAVPQRPALRKSTQRSWRSSRGASMLLGPSASAASQMQRRRSKLGLVTEQPRMPSRNPSPKVSPVEGSSHGRQPSQTDFGQRGPPQYHLPTNRQRGSQVHVRPSPQRKPTIRSIESTLQEEEEEHMATPGPSSSTQFAFNARPPIRSSSFASLSSHNDTYSQASRPSTGNSVSRTQPSTNQSHETAPTSLSGCSAESGTWLSDSDSEEDAWQEHVPLYGEPHNVDEDEEDMVDPAGRQMGQLSLQQQESRVRGSSTHENLLARKYSIERAAKTRLARTPSKRVRYQPAGGKQ